MVVLRRKAELSFRYEGIVHSGMSDEMARQYPLDILNVWYTDELLWLQCKMFSPSSYDIKLILKRVVI